MSRTAARRSSSHIELDAFGVAWWGSTGMHKPLAPKVLDGEVLAPGQGTITVIVYPHPLRGERTASVAAAGCSISEVAPGGGPHLAVLFGDRMPEAIIPSELWHRVRPKPGTTLVFRAVLHGKNIRTIAMIGVAVAAIAASVLIAPWLTPALVPMFGSMAGSVASVIGGLAAAAITIGGTMLINTLIPLPKPAVQDKVDDGSLNFNRETVYSISGSSNQARSFGA